MTPIVFLDTETDGIHPGRKAYDIAMIRRDEHGERAVTMFVAIDLSTADPFGLKEGRFYDRHPQGRYLSGLARDCEPGLVSTETAAEHVARWTHGAHIVGAVPSFDTETLAPLLREHGMMPAWHHHLIDVEALAVGYVHAMARKRPGSRFADFVAQPLPWKSDDLSLVVGVSPPVDDDRHTALGDALWAKRIYDAITGQGSGEAAG